MSDWASCTLCPDVGLCESGQADCRTYGLVDEGPTYCDVHDEPEPCSMCRAEAEEVARLEDQEAERVLLDQEADYRRVTW